MPFPHMVILEGLRDSRINMYRDHINAGRKPF